MEYVASCAHPGTQEVGLHRGTMLAMMIRMENGMGREDSSKKENTGDHGGGKYRMTKPFHVYTNRETSHPKKLFLTSRSIIKKELA